MFIPLNSLESLVMPFHTARALPRTVHFMVEAFKSVIGVWVMNCIFFNLQSVQFWIHSLWVKEKVVLI